MRRFISGMEEAAPRDPARVCANALPVFQDEMNHDGNNRNRHK
jgi:hypothetical protein